MGEVEQSPGIDKQRKIEPEIFDSRSIGIATTTFYKQWTPLEEGQTRRDDDVDGIRGDLALATIAESARKGFQIVVVDAPVSSPAFKDRLSSLAKQNKDIHIFEETEKGMSPGRRQAFKEVRALDGVKVVAWTEPEKISVVRDCLPQAAAQILSGEADIVVPKRDDDALSTYPDYQAEWEKKANKKYNKILKEHGLLPEDAEELDVWFGPRFIKNDPEVLKLFLHPWEIGWHKDENLKKTLDPELWPNATFLPVVAALWRDKQLDRPPSVVSVPVRYTHPPEQARNEQDSPAMQAKREQQYNNIVGNSDEEDVPEEERVIGAVPALIQALEFDKDSGNNLYSLPRVDT